MKMLKKHLTLLLALVMMALVVAGCGGAPAKPAAKPETKPAASRIDQIKKNGKLILATGNYRPFEKCNFKCNTHKKPTTF